MKNYRASVEKLRRDAFECALIRDLATDKTKREMFDRLREHFDRLADEVEVAMGKTGQTSGEPSVQRSSCGSLRLAPNTHRRERSRWIESVLHEK